MMMSGRLRVALSVALTIVSSAIFLPSCYREGQAQPPDYSMVDSIAAHDAGMYIAIPRQQTMRRMDYLLNVKSRQGNLEREAGEDYATRYITVFEDSVRAAGEL